jgi:choice-of-anchor C domain-containing protein
VAPKPTIVCPQMAKPRTLSRPRWLLALALTTFGVAAANIQAGEPLKFGRPLITIGDFNGDHRSDLLILSDSEVFSRLVNGNRISNGSFEPPEVPLLPFFRFAGESFGGWQVLSGSVDVDIADVSIYQAADGVQFLDLSGAVGDAGIIEQSVPVTNGRHYNFRFAMAGSPNGGPPIKQMRVLCDGVLLGTPAFDTTGRSATNMGYIYTNYPVTAVSNLMRIRFESITSSGYGMVIDAVSLTEEPTAPVILSNIHKGDILWQNTDGRLAFWLMDKTSVLESVKVAGANLNSLGRALALNDFDHDGHDDILFQQTDGRLVIGFLNGTTVTRTQIFTAANGVPRGWQFSGLADFNNDGKKDLLWNTGQGLVAWMLDGTRIIGERSIETGPIFPSTQLLGAADFNHDGSTDLLWLNNGAVTVSFLSRGSYRYSTYLNGGKRVSRGWKVGGIGDLNGDGWPDILWRHDDGRLVAWLLNGTRIVEFVPLRPDRPVSPSWRIVGVE